jgi:DNA-binding transcriptional LysR family regulator
MTVDRLDAMRTFVAIVDEGSFSAAAKRLGVSVAAISRRLSGFEQRIGTPLLHRTTRSLTCTEYGHIYYDRAARILGEIEEVETELDGLRTAPAGLLRVSAPSVFGRCFVANLIPEFLNRFPRVRVDLSLVRPSEASEPGRVDAAITAGGEVERDTALRTLGSFRHVLCATPDYLRRAGRPRTPGDLSHHDCILEAEGAGASTWNFREDGRQIEQAIEGRLICDDAEAVLSLALAGSGVARIPSFQVRDQVRAQRLEVLLESFEPPPTPMTVAYMRYGPAASRAGAFVHFLASSIPPGQLGL